MPKKRIPPKGQIKKFDFTGTGRGPMPVTRRPLTRRPLTGGPAKSPYRGMEVGGKGGMPKAKRRKSK